MRRPSIRGFGIRYALALTLPVTGIALVLYTVVRLLGCGVWGRGEGPRQVFGAIRGSLGGAPPRASPAAPADAAAPDADAPNAARHAGSSKPAPGGPGPRR